MNFCLPWVRYEKKSFLISGIIIFLFYLIPGVSFSHDFWLEPSSYRPDIGNRISVRFMAGENFIGEPVPCVSSWIQRFDHLSGIYTKPVIGFEGHDPAGYCIIKNPGLQIIAFQSGFSAVELEAEKFEQYLRQEGLEQVIEYRTKHGENHKKGKEIFARSAKSFLLTGKGGFSGFQKYIGLDLEIIPETDPFLLNKQEKMVLTLLFHGEPVKNVLVKLKNKSNIAFTSRTNSAGRVTLPVSGKGVWLITAVHMVPAQPDITADWESYWSSLTFQVE